ncbi:VanZ family protein [Halobacillus salinus]|uniref:VanZ family protein n=1 Tax=Halobacillus salinus TaxID=192814 RepID=A0A4Z0GXC3_9BACI|nr:VanZ family protein [Halobacillus salinus]TGB01299.1 VanZ family protein [Halobacillus salinus]
MKKHILYPILIAQSVFLLLLPWMGMLTRYLHPAAYLMINLVLTLLTFILFAFALRIRYNVRPVFFHLGFLAYSFSMLFLLIIRSGSFGARTANWTPLRTIELYVYSDMPFMIRLYNLAANVGLFIPFGVYLMYVCSTWRVRIGISVAAIWVIETTQYVTARGSLDIDDFILNMMGVCIGFIVAPILKKRFVWSS